MPPSSPSLSEDTLYPQNPQARMVSAPGHRRHHPRTSRCAQSAEKPIRVFDLCVALKAVVVLGRSSACVGPICRPAPSQFALESWLQHKALPPPAERCANICAFCEQPAAPQHSEQRECLFDQRSRVARFLVAAEQLEPFPYQHIIPFHPHCSESSESYL